MNNETSGCGTVHETYEFSMILIQLLTPILWSRGPHFSPSTSESVAEKTKTNRKKDIVSKIFNNKNNKALILSNFIVKIYYSQAIFPSSSSTTNDAFNTHYSCSTASYFNICHPPHLFLKNNSFKKFYLQLCSKWPKWSKSLSISTCLIRGMNM